MKSKKLFLLVMLAMVVTLLAGCAKADAADQAPESTPQGAEATAAPVTAAELSAPAQEAAADLSTPVVYMTTDISAEGLMAIYEALGASPEGNIAVKLSTGEPGSNYLRTDLIGELVQSLDATIVECNTAYGGSRSNTEMHYQVAKDHGYTDIADVDIMDENGSMTLPVMEIIRRTILDADMMVFVTPLYYYGMSAQLKTLIDRFCAFNSSIQRKHMKSALLTVAWNSDNWTFDALEAHYKTLVRYLNLKDQGMVLGCGCGTPSMTKHSGYPKKAYALGLSV